MPAPTAVTAHQRELVRQLDAHLTDIKTGRVADDAAARAAYNRIDAELTEVEARIAEYKAVDTRESELAEARAGSLHLDAQSGGAATADGQDRRGGRFGDVTDWRSLNGRDPGHEVTVALPELEGRALTAGTATAGAETVQQSVAASSSSRSSPTHRSCRSPASSSPTPGGRSTSPAAPRSAPPMPRSRRASRSPTPTPRSTP